ncbi:hypothetical protein [Leptolyngbya sp. GGD]|uniref:hypothetical protein n=1 Tax=Leptolyngbya sp. GGD TaxID=2997907 RepID=UPI00227B2B28|nr:hypothetical protein [Leptolyngbya sp. GGD]MCY6491924.1 hypothetical protein [Leptolyngbya sp. GGD]
MSDQMKKFTFRNPATFEDRSFAALDFIGALNQVSHAWFDSSEVIDFHLDSSSRVTLLGNQSTGSVIGRVFYHN